MERSEVYLIEKGESEDKMIPVLAFDDLQHATEYCIDYKPTEEDQKNNYTKIRIKGLTFIKGKKDE